jgi:hypothetical protein
MKSIIILLIAIALCIPGGYHKIKDFKRLNDANIDRLIRATSERFFSDAMTNADLMTVEPIELYSQIVSGINYKVIFATQAYSNTRNDVQLHEYVFYKPLNFEENSVAELENVGSIKHFQSNGVSVNSPRYSQINAAISSYLMGSRNKLVSVNSVNAIEVYSDTYYAVKATIEGKNIEAGFVVVENKGEYEILARLN